VSQDRDAAGSRTPVTAAPPLPWPVAATVVAALTRRAETLAVAESFTGGLVCARIVDVAGSSTVLRGGVIAYATDLKHSLLGVPAALVASRGAVDPEVARAMAAGVRERLGATWGLATTGVAGPTGQDGKPPGTGFVAVAGPGGLVEVVPLLLPGSRPAVRDASARAALAALSRHLG